MHAVTGRFPLATKSQRGVARPAHTDHAGRHHGKGSPARPLGYLTFPLSTAQLPPGGSEQEERPPLLAAATNGRQGDSSVDQAAASLRTTSPPEAPYL